MAKKHKHEEHENHERWVVSYADFMTLLFALFVVLYASSHVDTNKLAETSQSMKWALNFKGTGGISHLALFRGPPTEGGCTTNMGSQPFSTPFSKQMVETMRKKLERSLKPFVIENKKSNASILVENDNGRLRIRLGAQRFFDAASASLRPESLAVLDAIGDELKSIAQPIRVEGHTDDEPINSTRFRSNWDLSASRAAAVVSYLEQAHSLPSDHLTAAGLGSTKPVVSNDTPEHRELNRRIEIVVEINPNDPRVYQPSPP